MRFALFESANNFIYDPIKQQYIVLQLSKINSK